MTSHRQAAAPRWMSALVWLSLCVLLVGGSSCKSTPRMVVAPISAQASAYFAQARQAFEVDRDQAREYAQLALGAAPGWVAPQRLLDDLLSQDLLGPRALAAHRAALVYNPDDAGALYLAARLEDRPQSRAMFQEATEIAPDLPWPFHGLAVRAAERGDFNTAISYERLALDKALDPWEAAHFRAQLATFLRRAQRSEAALEVLREGLQDQRLEPFDRVFLRLRLAELELRQAVGGPVRERGMRRAERLLAEEDLAPSELRRLVTAATNFGVPRGLRAALTSREGPGRREILTELLLESSGESMGLALLQAGEEAQERLGEDSSLRRLAFSRGLGDLAIEAWCAALPSQILAEDGLPKEDRLAQLVQLARQPETPERERELGEALLRAGWFQETAAYAEHLAATQLDVALDLERRANQAQSELNRLSRLARRLDGKRARYPYIEEELKTFLEPSEDGQDDKRKPQSPAIRNLEGFLRAMGFVLSDLRLGLLPVDERTEEARIELTPFRDAIKDSPLIHYSVLGEVVHPGPWFSAEDERLGRGKEGELVPGVADAMHRLLRFAIIGTSLAAKIPDAAILKRLWVERRSGEHLGRPWSGTIVWCEGVDLPGRAARNGASIAGAALHEGYYVDLEPLRRSLGAWRRLEAMFSGEGALARLRAVLAVPPLAVQGNDPKAHLALGPSLGATDRLRLAVLAERGDLDPVQPLGSMTLEELVTVTELHEEGHLCDRAAFYPPGRGWVELLFGVVWRGLWAGGSHGVLAELEYRAQLVALCTAEDPRLPLVELIGAAEGDYGGGLPHGDAYRRLLKDFLGCLDGLREAEPEAWRALNPDRLYVQSLHRLRPNQIRTAAKLMATKLGLARSK